MKKLKELTVLSELSKVSIKNYSIDETQLSRLVRICAQLGNESGLKLLLHLKAPVDHADADTGQTALHLAVIKNHLDSTKL